jgi:hypothetical protein
VGVGVGFVGLGIGVGTAPPLPPLLQADRPNASTTAQAELPNRRFFMTPSPLKPLKTRDFPCAAYGY